MSDLISRKKAICALADADAKKLWKRLKFSEMQKCLLDLPPEEPERKKGEWIVTNEFEDCIYAKCNQCQVTQVFYYGKPLTNFCPNCGADMRGNQNEQVDI